MLWNGKRDAWSRTSAKGAGAVRVDRSTPTDDAEGTKAEMRRLHEAYIASQPTMPEPRLGPRQTSTRVLVGDDPSNETSWQTVETTVGQHDMSAARKLSQMGQDPSLVYDLPEHTKHRLATKTVEELRFYGWLDEPQGSRV